MVKEAFMVTAGLIGLIAASVKSIIKCEASLKAVGCCLAWLGGK